MPLLLLIKILYDMPCASAMHEACCKALLRYICAQRSAYDIIDAAAAMLSPRCARDATLPPPPGARVAAAAPPRLRLMIDDADDYLIGLISITNIIMGLSITIVYQ